MGLNQHFFASRKGYATTFVNTGKHYVFDVQLGRSEASLRNYLKALPHHENFRLMATDLSETFRGIARRYFPNSTIVAARFNVVRFINHHFLNAWRPQDPDGLKNRGLVSFMRRLK